MTKWIEVPSKELSEGLKWLEQTASEELNFDKAIKIRNFIGEINLLIDVGKAFVRRAKYEESIDPRNELAKEFFHAYITNISEEEKFNFYEKNEYIRINFRLGIIEDMFELANLFLEVSCKKREDNV